MTKLINILELLGPTLAWVVIAFVIASGVGLLTVKVRNGRLITCIRLYKVVIVVLMLVTMFVATATIGEPLAWYFAKMLSAGGDNGDFGLGCALCAIMAATLFVGLGYLYLIKAMAAWRFVLWQDKQAKKAADSSPLEEIEHE